MNTQDSYFIFLNKPAGLTSHQCLHRFKKQFDIKKIGHHGTLDPFATGLLLVGVNQATKFFQFIDDTTKTYQAEILLGQQTDTLDCTGQVVNEVPVPDLKLSDIDNLVEALRGEIKQIPPMYSAIKINGKKLYQLARKGEVVERPERDVKIHKLKILNYNDHRVQIEVSCSRGTYIRVLAEQIAKQLKTLGHLTSLSRTELCGVGINKAFDMNTNTKLDDYKIPILDMLSQYPVFECNDKQALDLKHGKLISADSICNLGQLADEQLALALFNDQFLGMVKNSSEGIRSNRLMSY
ncbi:tRNA pseudouridine(55) synthase TruB [bacterium K02(2017)]|nr:tRNA pseudouridine(55) synthase TruB [bacterium K02(2017)]